MICLGAAALTAILVEAVLLAVTLVDSLNPASSVAAASMGYGVAAIGSAVILGLALVVVVQTLTAAYRFRVGYPVPASVRRSPRTRRLAGTGVVGMCLVGTVALTSATGPPPSGDQMLEVDDTAVIAHRGFVGGGVENTIGALEAAAAVGPDFEEIDAQQTRNGRFVLSHDVNLWLVSGRNVNVHDLTLDEATATTVSVGGFSDTMSSLTSYVKRAEELGVTLMIELKTHGQESSDVVDRFLQELDSLGSTRNHAYHSLNVGVVEELKAKRPELTVGRTIAARIGSLSDVPCNFLLVEQSFYSEEFVRFARDNDTPLLAWTVDDEDAIRDYLRVPVSGIVTDRPAAAMRERERIANERGVSPWLRDALDQFKLF